MSASVVAPPAPLVTVIVPGRDVADLVPAALDSLLAQSEPCWRAILVDDGSRDATGAVMSQYARADSRFTLMTHEEARGLGAARNVALEEVTTDFVAYLDADDEMRPDALQRALSTLTRTGSDILVGAYTRLRWDNELTDWVRGPVQPWVASSTTPSRERTSVDEHPDVVGNIVAWSKVSRLALWTRTGVRFPENILYEDQVVAQQLYTAANGIDVIEDVLVDWRIRADGGSITQREADPDVLADCLSQMAAGLNVLRERSPRGAARRTTQILRMDVPRLATIAAADERSRALLSSFVRTLQPSADDLVLRTQSVTNPSDPAAPTVADVYERVLGW